jgi:hypothetical protein
MTCQMRGCTNAADPKPVFDANPDTAARKQVGEVAICDPCQARINTVNARVAATISGRYERNPR